MAGGRLREGRTLAAGRGRTRGAGLAAGERWKLQCAGMHACMRACARARPCAPALTVVSRCTTAPESRMRTALSSSGLLDGQKLMFCALEPCGGGFELEYALVRSRLRVWCVRAAGRPSDGGGPCTLRAARAAARLDDDVIKCQHALCAD